MKFHSICITGVDGAGKSTIVNEVAHLFLDGKCTVQYMGLKNWETPAAQKVFTSSRHKLMGYLRSVVLIHELRHRVYKYKDVSRAVIFDRYVDEQVLQLKKRRNTFRNKLLTGVYQNAFVEHFYQPDIYIYLTCSLEDSISRKSDISNSEDIEKLMRNKCLMDEYYFSKENVYVIDTSKLSLDETLKKINNLMRGLECFSTLMK